MTFNKNEIILEAHHIKKYFGATHANDDVSIQIPRGHVRGLIGENGSGKSTFISIIAGIQQKDSGDMSVLGNQYNPETPLDAVNNKIGVVVQELGLVDGLPVGINLFLGHTDQFSNKGILNIRELNKAAVDLFKKWSFPHFANLVPKMTDTLSVEEKKIVELVRALSIDPELLILDEITQALSLNNRRTLFDIIKKLKSEGKAVLMVTHDIEEVLAVTDSITIMRDGVVVTECDSNNTTVNGVKHMMVGRDLTASYYREDTQDLYEDEIVLSVNDLTAENFQNVSFNLHKGEILGICGLSDSGIHELAEALFAVREVSSGTVVLSNSNTVIQSPRQAMSLKIGYVPKDRDKQALMVNDTIENNVCLPAVELIKGRLGFLNPREKRELTNKVIKEFNVKANDGSQIIRGLSGGNRQKVNLGRWMIQDKEILILDCPTRGVDIGVKAYIYNAMIEAKNKGISMIVVSDELPELIGMSDTILIMKNGVIKKTVKRSSGFTEESIIEVML